MFAEVLLPLSLTLIMGSLGMTLTPADFKRVVTAPRGVGIGLVNLLLVSPLLAFAIGEVYGLAAVLAVGVVLLGASPGGTTANMLTHLARGDVALSVSMTAVSSVASVITVPLFLSLGADWFDAQDVSDEISMPGIAARVFLITIIPLAIGMFVRARRTGWTLRNMHRARTIALVAFVLVVAGAIITEIEPITDAFGEIAAAVITLNVLAMTISYFVSRAARLGNRQATAIAMELGVHNTTVALAVATSVDDELAGPAAVYGLFMFVTAGLFARLMARRNAAAEVLAAESSPGSIEMVARVPGTPDAVWRAVATGPGLSAWLADADLEGDHLDLDLGDLGHAHGGVVLSEPPSRFAFSEDGWLGDSPPLFTEFQVEDDGGGFCRVRLINRVDGPSGPAEREALGRIEEAWRPSLVALRLHLEHHAGQPGETLSVSRPTGVVDEAKWKAAVGTLSAGRVEHSGDREAVLRLDAPAPGHAVVTVDEGHHGPLATVRATYYGPDAVGAVDHERAAWEAWLREHFG